MHPCLLWAALPHPAPRAGGRCVCACAMARGCMWWPSRSHNTSHSSAPLPAHGADVLGPMLSMFNLLPSSILSTLPSFLLRPGHRLPGDVHLHQCDGHGRLDRPPRRAVAAQPHDQQGEGGKRCGAGGLGTAHPAVAGAQSKAWCFMCFCATVCRCGSWMTSWRRAPLSKWPRCRRRCSSCAGRCREDDVRLDLRGGLAPCDGL